jgi:Tol biopolymer transport system component
VLAVTNLTDYQLPRDASFITFREDATEKTDYDVISGTHNHLKIARGGTTSTLIDAKTLKTTNPRWSDDGTMFAFAEKGEVFVQSVHDTTARSLTPKRTSTPAASVGSARAVEASRYANR